MSAFFDVIGQWLLGFGFLIVAAVGFTAVMVFFYAPEAERARELAGGLLVLSTLLFGLTYGIWFTGAWVLQLLARVYA